MRACFAVLHRWFGLFTALFLFVAGLTGAVISWDHELDAALNPRLFVAGSGPQAQPLPVLDLANRLEKEDPRLRVTYASLGVEPGRTLLAGVEPVLDPATGKPFMLGFNQVALDPATGAVQGLREWGHASLSRENLLPFLYKLHYSLHLPEAGGLELGVLFMGFVGMVWFVDCFVALCLSFPKASVWRKSFAFSWRQGSKKFTFDLHRSGGVWVWGLLLVLATTSVGMNLGNQVMRPLVSVFSTLTPTPFASRTPRPPDRPVTPIFSREQILDTARLEAARRGWTAPAGGVFYSSAFGLYGVGFFAPGNDHGDGGLGNPWLYFDGQSGAAAGANVPGTGSAGDTFLQAQFPLHSGRLFGLTGRILVSVLGLVVAMLSLTGGLIWFRRRLARQGSRDLA